MNVKYEKCILNDTDLQPVVAQLFLAKKRPLSWVFCKACDPIGRSNKLLNNFLFCHIHLWNVLIPCVTNAPNMFSHKSLSLIDLFKYLKGDFYSSF